MKPAMPKRKEPPDQGRPPYRPAALRAMGGKSVTRTLASVLIGLVLVYLLVFLPLPYFIYKPGTAEEIRPMVHVKSGAGDEAGTFMLTTVRVTDTNVVNYFYALLAHQQLVPKKAVFRNGESEDEYTRRQDYIMLDSQSNAMQAAYKKAGIPYHLQNEGVMVLQVLDNMPAAQALQPGDYLLQLDGKPMATKDDVLGELKGKKEGDTVRVTYKRGNRTATVPLTLALLPVQPGEAQKAQPGLGIVPADVHSVKADDPDKQVSIQAGEIGGPSAGLMFSLEIYNQLTPDDLTKGYRIAGTGTIDPDGNVGVIGGIQHKIVAADREKADIFFAPKDYYPAPGEGSPVLNTTDARAEARKIHSAMKIVSVGTMDDAIRYLRSLPPKSAGIK
jgi:PDZ domain-containing protein